MEWERGFPCPAESAKLIEANHVIDMAMGIEHRVEAGELFPQCLLP